MALQSPANNAFADAVRQAAERFGIGHCHGIALVPIGKLTYDIALVDASHGDGRYVEEVKKFERVPFAKVGDRVKKLRVELVDRLEDPDAPPPIVLMCAEHEGEYRQCWRSVDPETLHPFPTHSKEPILVAYNPTIC